MRLNTDHCLVSEAIGVDGYIQYGSIGISKGKRMLDTYHPAVWYGSAESVVDLIPANGFIGGDVTHSNEKIQAGFVWSQVNHNDSQTDEKACL
ncbi:MAG: hypothetical protein GWO07_09590 [Candidatus Dadabacteria bacterium]|nr:hypothetical protein [Candidatus Dadabacteria bacterium]NIS08999.1 hypothetical protein [Candidatus Dadabacteria bacterium]NIV41041.1 hypothetical protein [Candidatus Dadabacteria bacterium]NIX15601.1 hypothetical protein [Candidatus Dadabacteria bacterium]NIY22342.1 hypothetical protein [Candidatus Dadabacteria bacterium]